MSEVKVLCYTDPRTLIEDMNSVFNPKIKTLSESYQLGDHKWIFINLADEANASRLWREHKGNVVKVYQWGKPYAGMDSRLDDDVFTRFLVANDIKMRTSKLLYLYKK
jgi:hypothetical protein